MSVLFLELLEDARAVGKLASSTSVPLAQTKFPKRQKGHLQSRTGKGGVLEQGGGGGEASVGNCGQGPYKNENSISKNRRCQLESADPSGWRAEVPRTVF